MKASRARQDVVKRLVEAAMQTLAEAEPDATACELTSAAFTLLNVLIERVLEHSQPEYREYNRQSVEECLRLILQTIKGTQRPH